MNYFSELGTQHNSFSRTFCYSKWPKMFLTTPPHSIVASSKEKKNHCHLLSLQQQNTIYLILKIYKKTSPLLFSLAQFLVCSKQCERYFTIKRATANTRSKKSPQHPYTKSFVNSSTFPQVTSTNLVADVYSQSFLSFKKEQ